jgi:hypothetical protein
VVGKAFDDGGRDALRVGVAGQPGAVGAPVVVAASKAHRGNDARHEATGTRVRAWAELPLLHSATWYKYKGKHLISFGAWKNHLAVYGMNSVVAQKYPDDPNAFDISGGTIRFTADKPLPPELVEKLVQARIEAIEANSKKK